MSGKRSRAPIADLLVPAVGAMIFASDEPVPPQEIAEALGQVPVQEVEQAIAQLGEAYEENSCGLRLEKIAGRPLEWKDGSWTPRSGTLLVGTKGVVHTNAHNSVCVLLPESDFPNAGGRPRSFPSVAGHQQEWVAACKGGPTPFSNFDHSGPVIEWMLFGNVATLVNQPLEFDPVACKIPANDEADRALRPEHRQGWSV